MPSTIFQGRRNKLLTPDAILRKNGGIIDYDGDYDALNNGHFEKNTLGWAAYADAAGTVPVDGTGGSPNITITRSTTSPLGGIASGLITKDAANRQGQGVSYDFTIEQRYRKTTNLLVIDYEASANYTGESGAEYLSAWLYDTTNSKLYPFRLVNLPGSSGTFIVPGQYVDSGAYRIIFHISGTGTSAWTYKFKVRLQSYKGSIGNGIGQWKNDLTFTPNSGAFGTVVNNEFKYRQVGDSLEVIGYFEAGTTTASQAVIALPSGYQLDITKLVSGTSRNHVGQFWGLSSSSTNSFDNITGNVFGSVVVDVADINNVFFALRPSGAATPSFSPANGNTIANVGDAIAVRFTVPIKQLAGQAQVVNSVVEYAYNSDTANATDTTSFAYGPDGTVFGSYSGADRVKRIRFKVPMQLTDKIFLQVSDGNAWQDFNSLAAINAVIRNGGTNYGLYFSSVNGTDYDVVFGGGGANLGGDAWSTLSGYRWRVVKVSNPLGVEVAAPQALASKSSSFALNTAGYANNEYAQMTGNSLTLTSGIWDIEFLVQTTPSGAATIAGLRGGLYEANGANDGTTPAALTNIEVGNADEVSLNVDNTTLVDTDYTIKSNPVRVRVAGTKTVYCVPRVPLVTPGAATVITYMFARRVA